LNSYWFVFEDSNYETVLDYPSESIEPNHNRKDKEKKQKIWCKLTDSINKG